MIPRPRYEAAPWWIALAIATVITLAATLALWHLRQDAVNGEVRELDLLSTALADEIDRGLQGVEEGFKAMRAELADGRLPLTGPAAVRALRTRADLMPLVSILWLIDADGKPLAASDSVAPPESSLFRPSLTELTGDDMAVSRPYVDPHSDGMLVVLGVRSSASPAASGGWILGAVPEKALLGAFSVASANPDARMAVFRVDGARVAGSIVATPSLDEASIAERLAEFRGTRVQRFRDGSERLVALQLLSRWGLAVVLTRDVDALLQAWHQTAWLTASGLILLVTLAVASLFVVQRANWRRSEAQQALATQVARASKLEALGTLAGGVAHDFNNILAAIVGFTEMAQDAAPSGSDQARHLDRVLQAALRGKTLSERILTFSRGGARTSTVFLVEPVVEEVLALLTASLRPGIVLERRFEAPDAKLRGDPTQFFEAVVNLCTNALQAMPEGGVLGVALLRQRITSTKVLSHSQVNPGDYLTLIVTDQGTGIAPDVMERLFEPFFTTRAGTGTGLGLAVVHGVVAEFGGVIDVQSSLGRGARFTLYIPESLADVGAAAGSIADLPTGAGQALMTIDDDPGLVSLTVEMLQGLGYLPVGFTDPGTALSKFLADPERFAAVVTDEVMPGLSGTQFAQALRDRGLMVPILLVSGYGGALLASRAASAGVTRMLTKPIQRAELACALAELLR